MKKTKTIVFDLDDTLVKEIDYLKSAFKEIAIFVDAKNDLLFDKMMQLYYQKENVFEYLHKEYENVNLNILKKMYRNHYPSFYNISETKELLLDLKQKGFKLGLITDGFSITQRNKINALNLNDLFDLVIISEEFGSEKPCENNFLPFKKFDTDEYFYIGDNILKDFIAANKLGWTTICLLDDGSNIHSQNFNKEQVYLPKIKIKSLTELKFHTND